MVCCCCRRRRLTPQLTPGAYYHLVRVLVCVQRRSSESILPSVPTRSKSDMSQSWLAPQRQQQSISICVPPSKSPRKLNPASSPSFMHCHIHCSASLTSHDVPHNRHNHSPPFVRSFNPTTGCNWHALRRSLTHSLTHSPPLPDASHLLAHRTLELLVSVYGLRDKLGWDSRVDVDLQAELHVLGVLESTDLLSVRVGTSDAGHY